MADAALHRLWSAVRGDYDRAQGLLPSPPADTEGSLARLAEWLDHNELELALDELESLGVDNTAGQPYWQHLQSAAARIGLTGHAERLGRRAARAAGTGAAVDPPKAAGH